MTLHSYRYFPGHPARFGSIHSRVSNLKFRNPYISHRIFGAGEPAPPSDSPASHPSYSPGLEDMLGHFARGPRTVAVIPS